ncbi:TetR/AcrR family transcriptional regulator [Mycobacterium stomatepiae]|uniref:TetR/AcrR family transcriptional regulator n=1 Tax=Mycobacterium stomatepiae TaxID=470076 RepID=UPI001E2CEEBD|nr:TetR/AcrR family transcriptional regulator [Mycobacterium stomatepiae]
MVATTRRGRPTHAESKKLQHKLRNAAVATFVKSGYDGTSMEAIAKAAGITRRTLYARYPDKRAVFLDVIPGALTRRTESVDTEEFEYGDLRAALVAVGRAGLARAVDPDVVRPKRIAMNESARFPEFAVSAHSMTWSARHRQVMELLRRHQDAGAIEVDDVELAAGHFIAAVEHSTRSAGRQWHLPQSRRGGAPLATRRRPVPARRPATRLRARWPGRAWCSCTAARMPPIAGISRLPN